MNGHGGLNGHGGPNGRNGASRLRIVRVANFVTPVSGGLRTALRHLGAGYLAAGHRPVLIVPGAVRDDQETEQGRVITLPGRTLPRTGGYRVLLDRARLAEMLAGLRPDRLEVSDRSTLRWTGDWARRHGVPAAMVSHESLDGLLRAWGLPERHAVRAADRLNAATARNYDTVVCTTAWAAAEFHRIGASNVVHAPLGVDLGRFHPGRFDPAARSHYAGPEEVLLVMCSRLSPEKRPERALDAVVELRRLGVPAVLAVAGDGPLRGRLAARIGAEALPVRLLGHLPSPALATLLASADAVLAPGPIEPFGLAALEAMACGTPVAVSPSSALPGLVGPAGAVAGADSGPGFADAVRELLARPEPLRRAEARARAERYGWQQATAAFLEAHRAAPAVVPVPSEPAVPARTGAARW